MLLAEPRIPDSWQEERLADGSVILAPEPTPHGRWIFLASLYLVLAIWMAWTLKSPGPLLMAAFMGVSSILGTLPGGLASWEWRVLPGSMEISSLRLGKLTSQERFERGALVLAAIAAAPDAPTSLEVHEGDRRHTLLIADPETLLQAGVYLAELTGWELRDSTSATSLLRGTLARRFHAGDKKSVGRLLADHESVPALLEIWRQSPPHSRDEIFALLKELGGSPVFSPDQEVGESPSQMLRRALSHSEPALRVTILSLLEELEGSQSATLLCACLEDPDVHVRHQAAAALCRLRDARSVPALCGLAASGDSKLRSIVVCGLSEMGDARAVSTLCQVLQAAAPASEPPMRAAAAAGLGRLRDPEGIPALSTALGDSAFRVRFAAAEALGRIGHVSALPHLETAALDADAVVRAKAAESLGRIGSPQVGRALGTLLQDSDPDVRAAAAEALGAAVIHDAVPDLCRALDDPEIPVRREAARAIGRIALGDARTAVALRAALPTLQRRLSRLSEAAEVKRACRVALERIHESTSGMKSLPLPAAAAAPGADSLPVPHNASQDSLTR